MRKITGKISNLNVVCGEENYYVESTFILNHGLNYPIVQVFDTESGTIVDCKIVHESNNRTIFIFNSMVEPNEYSYIAIG